MTWLKSLMHRNPRIPQAMGSAVALLIGAGQAYSYAASQAQQQPKDDATVDVLAATPAPRPSKEMLYPQEQEDTRPLTESLSLTFKDVKNKADACKRLNEKILVYIDQMSLVRDCKQHPIADSEALNQLVSKRDIPVVEVAARIYRMIPFGSGLEKIRKAPPIVGKGGCGDLEGRYVSVSGTEFYWIKDCKKRPFPDFFSMQAHRKSQEPLVTLSPRDFARLPAGKPMEQGSDSEAKVLFNLDGDISWRPLYKYGPGDDVKENSPESIKKDQLAARKETRSDLCKKTDRRIVSFYSQIYFMDDCKRRPVKDFSIEFQRYADETGGVLDLTRTEYGKLKLGSAISRDDLIKKIR